MLVKPTLAKVSSMGRDETLARKRRGLFRRALRPLNENMVGRSRVVKGWLTAD